MQKAILSTIVAIFAALLVSNAAMAGAIDNVQVQINQNQATLSINSTKPAPAPAPAPAPTVKDNDEDDHKDNGKHLGQKKKDKKD